MGRKISDTANRISSWRRAFVRGEEIHIKHTCTAPTRGARTHTAPRNTLHKAEGEVQLLLEVGGLGVLWESSSSDLEWVSLNKDQETDRPPTLGKHVLVLKFSDLLTNWETVNQRKSPWALQAFISLVKSRGICSICWQFCYLAVATLSTCLPLKDLTPRPSLCKAINMWTLLVSTLEWWAHLFNILCDQLVVQPTLLCCTPAKAQGLLK